MAVVDAANIGVPLSTQQPPVMELVQRLTNSRILLYESVKDPTGHQQLEKDLERGVCGTDSLQQIDIVKHEVH